MVKVASTLAFAALVAAPAFAAVIDVQGVQSRELTNQAVFGRDVAEVEDLVTRMPEEEDAVFMRDDLDPETLEARSKIGRRIKNAFRKAWSGIKKVGSVLIREDEIEQLDDVVARDLEDEVEEAAREFDEPEIDARELEDEETLSREFDDDVYERDIEVDDELMERDVDDLEELD